MSTRPCWIFYGTNEQNVKFLKDRVVPALSLEIKHWIGGLPDFKSNVQRYFPDVRYYSQAESNALIDEPIGENPQFVEILSVDFLNQLDNIFMRFKLNYNYRTRYDEINHCVNVARTYFNRLTSEKIEIAIFFEYPHSIGSYIAYLICRHLNIKTIIRTQSPFEDKVFYTSRVEEGISSYYSALSKEDHQILEQVQRKMKRSYNEAQPSYTKKQRTRLFLVSKLTRFSTYLEQQRWKRAIKALTRSEFDVKKDNFIYVGLHYQPELTSFPLGGIYCNQHMMILLLSAILPKDWKIIVKEHPTTFKYVKDNMALFRSDYYYKSLKNIPGVEFVDYDYDSFELIDNSKCSATLTGTIGFESVLRGKPCIVFGDAPFLGCEGVYRVTDFQSLKNAWRELEKCNFGVDENKVIAYTERALANSLYCRTNIDFNLFDDAKQLDFLLRSAS